VKKFGLEEIIEAPPPPSFVPVQVSGITEGSNFVYKHDLDTNGIIYHLNKGNSKDIGSGITVTSSGNAVGEPSDLINREQARCWTLGQQYSWYCVDFGVDRKIIATFYTIGYGSPGAACCPLYWLLQGSNKITRTTLYGSSPSDIPQNDPEWKTLAVHSNDRSLCNEWAIHSWKLNSRQGYRYFRVIQTGKNSCISSDDNWGQVLALNRFEIYGTLLPASANIPSFPSQPVYFGSSTFTPLSQKVVPSLIRGDPQAMREVQEIIIQMMKQPNEAKPEKIRVHEIILKDK